MTGSLVSRAGPESPCHVVVHINATAQIEVAAAHCALVCHCCSSVSTPKCMVNTLLWLVKRRWLVLPEA